jgi:branched-chain amino acid transport system substrate-binding protein
MTGAAPRQSSEVTVVRHLSRIAFISLATICAGGEAGAQLAGKEVHIGIGGPLTTGAASFGVEMRQAVQLAVDERNATGGILGAKIVADAVDDAADNQKGEAAAKHFCDDPADLAVVGHVNSGVTIAASTVYNGCGLVMLTPMASSPGVTDRGLANIFRLTNRDDRKGPGLASYLYKVDGKRRAIVVDDQTPYGKGLADSFAKGFEGVGGTILARKAVTVGDTDFHAMLSGLPKDFDFLFFGGIREGALILKQMRETGMNALFACGDGCWDVKGFIVPSEGAAMKGEGVRILSAAPSLGKVPGSSEFAARYTAKYGAINNYAANSYDSARIAMAAIEQAATTKKGMPTRAEVLSAIKSLKFQGIAYARPVEWTANGDNAAAVIFVNVVEGDHFREVDQIAGAN